MWGGGTRGDGVFVSVQGFAFLTATVDPANGNNERICAVTNIHFADLASRKPSLCAGSTNRQKYSAPQTLASDVLVLAFSSLASRKAEKSCRKYHIPCYG